MRQGGSIRVLAVVVLLLAATVALGAQERVGKIVQIDGYAEIDAFGNDRFIRATVDDVLYNRSVIRTEYEAWVTVEVEGKSFDLAPRSTTRVEALLPTYDPSPVSDGLRNELRAITQKAAQSFGMDELPPLPEA